MKKICSRKKNVYQEEFKLACLYSRVFSQDTIYKVSQSQSLCKFVFRLLHYFDLVKKYANSKNSIYLSVCFL